MQGLAVERRLSPPLGVAALADAARAWLDPARPWRRALIGDIAPRAGDVILDLDSDDAAFVGALARAGARVIAARREANPDSGNARGPALGARVEFLRAGAREALRALTHAAPNKIVARVCRRVERSAERIAFYAAAAASLTVSGAIHVIARAPLQVVDKEPLHEARALIAELRTAGFVAVEVTGVFPASRAPVMLLRGRAS